MGEGRKRPRKHSRKDDDGEVSAPTAAPVAKAAKVAKVAPAPSTTTVEPASVNFYAKTNPHKPSMLPSLAPERGARSYTLSVAFPGSIVRNAQTPELQARLAGHIARTCAIFNVDEIIVFDEGDVHAPPEAVAGGAGPGGWKGKGRADEAEDGVVVEAKQAGGRFEPNAFLARILQYIETPQYLRKALFPMHRDLRLAGLLPPLDLPHHLRFEDLAPYREGVTVDAPHWATAKRSGGSAGLEQVWVNVGLRDPIEVDVKGVSVPAGARVTVKMPDAGRYKGRLVSPREPVEGHGMYWGYQVRLCSSLSAALTTAPWTPSSGTAATYDLVIGTSERGAPLMHVLSATVNGQAVPYALPDGNGATANAEPLPKFEHALVVLGGLSGLEVVVEADQGVQLGADDAHELFDAWINVAEGQGSRTIRTEEALMIALARLKSTLETLGS